MIPAGAGDFPVFCNVQVGCGGHTQPLLQRVPGALSQSVKWPKHEADHSSPSNAEIRIIGVLLALPSTSALLAQGQTYPHIYLFKNHIIDKVVIPVIYLEFINFCHIY